MKKMESAVDRKAEVQQEGFKLTESSIIFVCKTALLCYAIPLYL